MLIIEDVDNKIPNTSCLVQKSTFNTKTLKTKTKTPVITG